MKNKNTFRKWMALFLSISMVAASGITSNVRLRAAEDTPVQETTAEGTTSGETDASASENAGETTVSNVEQNDTTRTEEIGLNGTEQAAEESAAPSESENTDTAADAEQAATPATTAESEKKETVADSTVSSSVSSPSEEKDKNLTAAEQIDEACKDATKREYSYDDDLVSVTATLDDPKAVPDNAEFRVAPVTKDSTDYNYDAYMKALNDDAAASSDSDTEKQYTDENTLLYDMAFIYPVEEKDENGNVTQKEVEVQPAEGAVKISVNFKKDQLTKSLDADKDSDVEIKHLPLSDAVKESNDTTADATNISASDVKVEDVSGAEVSINSQKVEFKSDTFSAYAFVADDKDKNEVINIEPGISRSVEDVLGDAIYYGITAESLTQAGHMDSNFAAITYNNGGNNFTLGAYTNGHRPGQIMAGSVTSGLKITTDNPVIVRTPQENRITEGRDKATVVNTSKEEINNSVQEMLNHVSSVGQNMLSEKSYSVKINDGNDFNNIDQRTIDFTKYGSGTFYINGDDFFKIIPDDFKISKNDDQVIVFNFRSEKPSFKKFSVNGVQSTESDQNADKYARTILFNMPNATSVSWNGGIFGAVLAPNATVSSFGGTSSGWLVAKNVTVAGGEWHCVFQDMREYQVEANYSLQAEKYVDNSEPKTNEKFTFTLDRKNGEQWDNVATINNDGSTVKFSGLQAKFDQKRSGTEYTIYRISEPQSQTINGVEYVANGATAYYAKVAVRNTVKYDNNQKINGAEAEVLGYYSDEKCSEITIPVFNNMQNEAGSTSIVLEGHKSFTGYPTGEKVAEAPVFTFTLSERNGDELNPVDTQTVRGKGDFSFKQLEYTAEGDHTYVVTEQEGSAEGVKYDKTKYEVNVSVKDNKEGRLVATVTGATNVKDKDGNATNAYDGLDFTNNYQAKETSVTFSGTKSLTGKDLVDGEFSFDLKDSKGNVLQTVQNGKDGTISFKPIPYTAAGQYTYTISEEATQEYGVTADATVYNITVEVTDDGSGQLKAGVTGLNQDGSGADFTNTYKADSTSVTLGGFKTVNGINNSDKTFSFTLSEGDTVLQTVTRTGAGEYKFDSISYKETGDHTYTVAETKGNAAGYTYDTKTYTVKVSVTDDKSGHLHAKISGDTTTGTDLNFTNTYKAKETSVTFSGTKSLTGKDLVDGEFSFDLKDSKGNVLQTVQNGKDGTISFKPIPYTAAGQYTYTISEEATQEYGVTADATVYNITVEVTDDGSGQLKAGVTGLNQDGSGADFTNTYKADSTSVTLGGFKTVNGINNSDKTFSFTLSEGDTVLQTVTRTGAGEYKFDSISYKETGDHTYTVAETKGNAAGYTYDTKTYTVKVSVTDDKSGHLHAKISGDTTTGTDLNFTNTYKAKETSVTFSGTKSLTGKDLVDGEFSFDLKDSKGNVLQTVQNGKDGTISFKPIPYTAAGQYTYTISEEATQEYGVTADATVYNITVEVTDDGSGQLKAGVTGLNQDGSGADFTNTYKADSTSVTLGGFKTVNGINNSDKTFSFTLSEGDTVLQTVTRTGAGEYKFDSISYKETGDHTYTVAETKGSAAGYTYDTKTYTVKVSVTDDKSGHLHAKISGDTTTGTDLNFTNTYKAKETSVTFSGTKSLTGKDLVDGEFSFDLKDSKGNVLQTVQNGKDGTISFKPIPYTAAGQYTYTISEEATQEYGVTADATVYNITVEVTDDGSGQLKAGVTGLNQDGSGADFTNTYKADSTSVTLGGFKTVNGINNSDKTFSFTLSEGDTVLQTVTRTGAGEYKFDSISYKETGDHTYTVAETKGNAAGYTYDTKTYTVKVSVTDDKSGHLHAKISGDTTTGTDLNFTNTYKAKETSVTFSGTKSLTGKDLVDGEFSFDLKDSKGNVLQTVQNGKDGTISFKPIPYTAAGQYTYTISEEATQEYGVTADATVYNITVEVTDDGSGQLKAGVTGLNQDGSGADFTNTYKADSTSVTLGGFKTVNGINNSDKTFSFTLSEGDTVLQTVTRTGAGEYKFDSISYKETGDHTYTVAETKGSAAGYTYDTKTYTVKVSVTDDKSGHLHAKISGDTTTGTDLNFTNTYKAKETSVTFSGTKSLTGKDLVDGEFSFDLKDSKGNVLQTVQNGKDGTISFKPIPYTAAGQYTYTISEEATQEYGVTADATVYNITVEVTDDGSGQLKAGVTGLNQDGSGADFTNTYKADSTSVTLGGFKTVNGINNSDKTFSFTLSEGDTVLQTVTRTGAGEYKFDSISYKETGDHTYTVAETKGNAAGYTYDTKTYTVKVSVTDDKSGHLHAKISGDTTTGTDLNFTNTYKAKETSVTFSGTKSLTGKDLVDGEFSFDLKDSKGNVLQTVQNGKDGTISFKPIPYTAAGQYTYTISEEATQEYGVTADATVYNITVEVTDDGSGQLKAGVTGLNQDGSGADFTNTYKADSTSVTLGGFKTVNGINNSDKTFSFTLSEGDTVLQTVTRTGAGEYKFDSISYKETGDHTYTVAETKGNAAGYTYDTKTYTVKVSVTDDKSGHLHAKISGDTTTGTDLNFTNTYKAKETSVTFSGTKSLTGKDLVDGEFSFDLKDSKGNVLQTVQNGKDGTISFKPIPYTAAGQYTYTISEEATQEYGVTADATVYNITVEVTDDGSGQLKAGVTGLNQDGSGADFTNTYKADSTSVTLGGFKTVNGINNSDKTFSFTLSEGDTVLQTVTRTGAGEYKFDSISYKETGDHTYTVAETKGSAAGYTYDTKTYTVKVSVTDDKSGHLHAKISGDTKNGTDLDFTNTYQAQAASAVISGTKTLNGVPASVAGQFRFDLFDANGNRIDTAANDEKGNFIFGKLHFEKAGDYTYTIKEQNAGEIIDGIKYPDEERTVTITVKDDGKGKLVANNATVTAFDNKQFAKVTVRKDWDDAGNESYRPSTVVIDLIDTNTGATVQKLELSEVNNWQGTFDQLEAGKSYTVHEEENDEFYKALNNDQVVTADVNGTLVDLTNKFIHKPVTVYANKVLNGGTLTNGEFMFALYRNSDPEKVYRTAANNAAGEIFFTDVEYDEKGYTVREIQGSDASVAYDSDAIEYDAEGNVTSSSHAVLTNTVRPIVLRVQKRSRTAPYDPLPGATYGLYEVVKGGNDILIESQVSDENGYMYFGKIQPSTDGNTHIYYFKEIAAPEGHEVDPYIGQKFQVRYTGNGEIALFSEDGQTPVTIGDITSQNAENLLVQHTSAKTALDTTGALTYSDSKITATAQAADGAFEAGTTMKVEPLTGSELKDAQNKVEIACGKIASNVVYYNVEFVDKNGTVVEPKFGDVTVTIQYKDSLALPEGTDAKSLKIVHLKEKSDGTEVQAVAGSIAANSDKLLQASFTSDSFSKFGIVEPSADNSSLNSNYLVTAAGVSDQVSRLNIAKLDTSGKYLKGARLQIIEKATGRVMADWTTTDRPETFARWFDEAQTKSMNVDTYYILHEVSAPEGYQLADDILFKINKYDSSITIYKMDENGNLVADQEAIDKWVSDHTLDMIDVPVEYQTKKVKMQKTVKYEKLIQGKDKVVYVRNAKAVKTGDASNIAMYAILLAAAGAVLIILFRARREGRRKVHKN